MLEYIEYVNLYYRFKCLSLIVKLSVTRNAKYLKVTFAYLITYYPFRCLHLLVSIFLFNFTFMFIIRVYSKQ